jgi:hypothetical protein
VAQKWYTAESLRPTVRIRERPHEPGRRIVTQPAGREVRYYVTESEWADALTESAAVLKFCHDRSQASKRISTLTTRAYQPTIALNSGSRKTPVGPLPRIETDADRPQARCPRTLIRRRRLFGLASVQVAENFVRNVDKR